MSENESETTAVAVTDDQLPEDLVGSDDNPLAEPLPDDVDGSELLHGGKTADESSDAEGAEGADDPE